MKRIGVATVAGGGVAVIGSLFVHYAADTSVWQLTTRYPVLLTILALVAIGLTAASLAVNRTWLLAVATAVSAFILGEAFPAELTSYNYQLGFWLAVAGAAIMVLGGIMATAASIKESRRAWAPNAAHTANSGAAASGSFGNGATVPAAANSVTSPGAPSNRSYQTADSPPGGATAQAADAPAAAALTSVLPPAGWYPDPARTAEERYWSGQAWTEDVRGARSA